MTEAVAGIIAAGISAAAAGASTGVQAGRGKKGREQAQAMFSQQMAFAREQWDYQKYAAENAYQIATADAEKAGLSPLAVLDSGVGSATSANGVSQPSAYDPSAYSPDMNTLVDGARAASEMYLRGVEEQGRNARNKEDNDTTLAGIQKEYEGQALLLSEKGFQDAAKLQDQLAVNMWLSDSSQAHDQNMATIKSFKDATAGVFDNYRYYSDKDDYIKALQQFRAASKEVDEWLSQQTDIQSGSASESSSHSSGVNAGLNVGPGGANAGANMGDSSSASTSQFTNRSRNISAEYGKKLNELGVPYPLLASPSKPSFRSKVY